MDTEPVDAYSAKIQVYWRAAPMPVSWTEAYDDLLETLDDYDVILKPIPRLRPADAVTVAMSPTMLAIRQATDNDFIFKETLEKTKEPLVRSASLVDADEWRVWLIEAINTTGQLIYTLHRHKGRKK